MEENRRTYKGIDYWSKIADQRVPRWGRDRWEQRLIVKTKIVHYIEEVRGSVLDCGCGTAPMYDLLKDFDYYGIDITEKFIEYCKNLYYTKKDRFMLGNILDIAYSDSSFNTVFCSEVMEHLPPKAYHKAIEEMFRVAKRQVIIDFYIALIDSETVYSFGAAGHWDNVYNRGEILKNVVMEVLKKSRDFNLSIIDIEGVSEHTIVRVILL